MMNQQMTNLPKNLTNLKKIQEIKSPIQKLMNFLKDLEDGKLETKDGDTIELDFDDEFSTLMLKKKWAFLTLQMTLKVS